jgi:hypothetical protein
MTTLLQMYMQQLPQLNLPRTGTTTQGETYQEAIKNLKEASNLFSIKPHFAAKGFEVIN